MLRRVVAAAILVAALAAVPSGVSGGNAGFVFGFSEDLPKQIGTDATAPAAELGAGAFRLTLQWTKGQTALSATDTASLDRATGAASGMRVILAVYGASAADAPLDATSRDQYCGYLRTVLQRYSSIRDVVVWNEPNKSLFWKPQLNADGTAAAAGAYEALLAQCYDTLHAVFAGVHVYGLALSSTGTDNAGSASPGAFIRGVGTAYRASGRTAPILDTVSFHPYPGKPSERPWAQHIGSTTMGEGDWNKLMYNLWQAFNGTTQAIPGENGVTIWYLEDGFQTTVPADKAALYSGTENVAALPAWNGGEPESPAPADTSAAPDQGTQVLDAIRLAACQPGVAAWFNFLLADEPILTGWQSGPLYVDRTRKPSYPAFQQAIAAATSSTVDCDALKGGRPSGDFMPPSTPANLAGAASPGRVDLSWSASSDDASAISYRVYRNGAWIATTAATSWSSSGLPDGTTYTYSLRAIDSAGNLGNASGSVTVTTPDTTAPAAPASVTATQSAGNVGLTWAAATDNVGIASYEISRDGVVLATATATATSYTDASIASNMTYTYGVVALDAAGNRSAGATATVTTTDAVAPAGPVSVTATAADGPPRIALAWPAATDDVGVTGYDVLRDGIGYATTSVTSFTDSAVLVGQTHAYAVRARDAAGNLGPAVSVSATVPDQTAPKAPGSFRVGVLSHPVRVTLSWTASSDNVAVTGYRIYRNGALVGTTTATSVVDTGVRASTTYRYFIVAIDAAGNQSASTSTLQVTTPRK